MRKILTTLIVLLFSLAGFAKDIIIEPNTLNKLGKGMQVFSTEEDLTVHQVLIQGAFMPIDSEVPNLGVSNKTHWIKFTIHNKESINNLLIDINNPILDVVNLYTETAAGYDLVVSGEQVPISDRYLEHQDFLFPLDLAPGEKKNYLLQVKSGEQVLLPVLAGETGVVMQNLLLRNVIMGLYFGLILVMFFYNLFIYFTTKDRSYLTYVVYILSVGLVQANLQGFTYKFLWPNSPWLAANSVYILNTTTAILAVTFMRGFVHIKDYLPKLNRVLDVFLLLYVGSLLLAIFGNYNFAYTLMNFTALALSIYMLVILGMAVQRGSRPAKFFMLAWSVFLVGVILFVFKDASIIPHNNLTAAILQIGSGAEVILLSFGLADKINTLKKEKEESQKMALEASKENERIVREQNMILEAKVSERTKELRDANTDLETALTNLKNAQTQLVDQEKMASLGQLTAGIAHEINNPINFVTSNVSPLKRDVSDVFEVLDKYGEITSGEQFDTEKEAIEELKEEVELDFVRTEINSLLKGIEEGASRTAEIVRGLKVFSRMDEQDLKRVDLREGINSTLTLLRSSMHGRIDVERNYEVVGNVECYAGKLNQVFMNILSNSIHAILAANREHGSLKIAILNKDADNVLITIEDNGTGMPDHVKQRIFEPFFTTKKVGEGTGLGMSISYSIIEKHNGTIEVETKNGEGTKFLISLPKLQTEENTTED